jgi:hypothetical protein
MSPQYRDDQTSNLPEVHRPEQQNYAYSLPHQSQPYPPLPADKGYYSPPENVAPAPARKGWMRWWILALIGLFIALIAGLVGGLAGQAIEKGRSPSTSAAESSSSPSSSCPNPNSNSTTPSPGAPSNVLGGPITIPDTGCNFPDVLIQRAVNSTTKNIKANYTTLCNTGWTPPKDQVLVAIWSLTPSDCVEACWKYNQNANTRQSKDGSCVGAGYLPSWVNQTAGAEAQGGQPFNCNLMKSTQGIKRNDNEIEVVALCLPGQCNNVGVPMG